MPALLLGYPADLSASADPPTVRVRGGEHPTYSRIVFDFAGPVVSQVQPQQDNYLVITFDQAATFDLSQVRSTGLSRIQSIDLGSDQASVRIRLTGAYQYELSDGGSFKVVIDVIGIAEEIPAVPTSEMATIAIDPAAPAEKPQPEPRPTRRPVDLLATLRAKTTAAMPHRAVALELRRSKGINGSEHRFADLRPALGEASDPASAGQSLARPKRPPSNPARPAFDIAQLPQPLFDLTAWRGAGDFATGLAQLRAASSPNPGDSELLDFARLHFSWHRIPEARSFLNRLKARNSPLATKAEVQAMAEALAIVSDHAAPAGAIFDQEAVAAIPEVRLWRGAQLANAQRSAAALPEIMAGIEAMKGYPADFRGYFGLLGMEAALISGKLQQAATFSEILAGCDLQNGDAAMYDALTGWLLVEQGLADEAVRPLRRAARAPGRRAHTIGRLQLVKTGLREGRLTAREAQRDLEELYYNWEGDDLQLQVMENLARLLADEREYAEAFNILRAGAKFYGTNDRGKRMAEESKKLFSDLLDDEELLQTDPVHALALFDENRDLLPSGAASEAILRRYAGWLAKLDLADTATALGAEPPAIPDRNGAAELQIDLADSKIRGGDADGALALLNSLDQGDLSEPHKRRFSNTLAQALAHTGKLTEAIAALGDSHDTESDRLRGDLYWQGSQWKPAADSYLAAVGGITGDSSLSEHAARLILRAAAALILAGAASEIADLRDRFGSRFPENELGALFQRLTDPEVDITLLTKPETAQALAID